MNKEYNIIIEQLKNNINEIITLYKKEKELNNNLTDEIQLIRNDLNSLKEKYSETEKKYNNLKSAKSIVKDDVSTHETRVKLNRIIREIDNCIALINK